MFEEHFGPDKSTRDSDAQTLAEVTEWCHEQIARTDDPEYTPADLFISQAAKEVLKIIVKGDRDS